MSGPLQRRAPMRVAFIAAECEPWAKTGGLADVVDALARALGEIGEGEIDGLVDVFLPRYRGMAEPEGLARVARLTLPDTRRAGAPSGQAAHRGTGIDVELLAAETHGYRLHLVDCPAAFDRDGYYGDATGDHPDNAWRFGLLCRAALEQLRSRPKPPDVIHVHDWHAAPAVLLRDGPLAKDPAIGGAAMLLTIHNLAYHGWTPAPRVPELGLGPGVLAPRAEGLDLLEAGIEGAELVNTVSPGFAREALTPELGMGLDGVLRARGNAFFGILNGLDTELWNPATDAALAAPYDAADRTSKATCRRALLSELGFDPLDPRPVLSMIGRLDRQKGFDLLAEAAPALVGRGLRLAVLGTGSADEIRALRGVAESPVGRGRIAIVERFDRDLARRLYAGSDGFLMPSRFEPCGTGQMISLRYGTPPIVHATGGLLDTVIDVDAHPGQGTGFSFEADTPAALIDACERFRGRHAAGGPGWEALLDRGMAVDFDWRSSSAPQYLAAYRRAIDVRRGAPG